MARWLKMVAELEADARVQQMHRDNVAKRRALRERRRALMLARHNKHLPMAVVIEAVEGNAEEWKELRVRECINRLGSDWLDRLIDMDASESVILYFLDVNDRIFRERLDEINDYRDEVDGVEVFHNCSFAEWLTRPHDLKRGKGCPRCAKHGFHRHDIGKLYIMVDDLEIPTMMKIGVSTQENRRSKDVLHNARKAGATIPALHVAKTWEGPTELMIRIEQMMHENYEEWNINFPAKFNGCTEFFYYTPETAEAFDVIEETLHEIINANKAA